MMKLQTRVLSPYGRRAFLTKEADVPHYVTIILDDVFDYVVQDVTYDLDTGETRMILEPLRADDDEHFRELVEQLKELGWSVELEVVP